MPTSKHRKTHKKKKSQRRAELDVKRHRTQVFAQKVEEAIRAYKAQEELDAAAGPSVSLPPVPGLSPLPAQEIFPTDYTII